MKRPTKHSLIGKWQIIEMELWDKDFLDMMSPFTSPSTARLLGIDTDFVIVAHQCAHSSSASRFTAGADFVVAFVIKTIGGGKAAKIGNGFDSHTRTCGMSLPYLPSTKYKAS